MSSITSSNDNCSFFKQLPVDIQYKIFQIAGTRISPFSLDKSVSELRKKYIDVEISKTHFYFANSEKYSLAGKAWSFSLNYGSHKIFTRINLALQILSIDLPKSRVNEITDKWGIYSLNIGRVIETEKSIEDYFLEKLWEQICVKLNASNSLKPIEIRNWLENQENQTSIEKIDSLGMSLSFSIIPKEINYFKHLKSLNIFCNRKLSYLPSLQGLINLTELGICHNQIAKLTPLQDLNNLICLRAGNNNIKNLNPLQRLSNLNSLFLEKNQISDLTPLQNLKNLSVLCLRDNQVQNIAPLQGLTGLKSLILSFNQVINLTPLQNLANLTSLSLGSNQIQNIEPLQGLIDLTYLELSDNQIDNITSLQNLTNLANLNLRNNKIKDPTPLQNLQNLTSLCLNDNLIENVAPLQNLINLTQLILTNN